MLATKIYAESILKPGIKHRDYEEKVRLFASEELAKLGFKNKTAVDRYFPHMTSHHLGLDTHDIATYGETLTEGMVLTIEPGFYIPEWGIGVRLEDDYLITDRGNTNLSSSIPLY